MQVEQFSIHFFQDMKTVSAIQPLKAHVKLRVSQSRKFIDSKIDHEPIEVLVFLRYWTVQAEPISRSGKKQLMST